mmetsp:Transcript_23184/g.22680  ORF Transcript_23184/g.22680 Transcript_23184/m.22680 type:complete len:101 (+) Transcript_23184:1712-2014(+)
MRTSVEQAQEYNSLLKNIRESDGDGVYIIDTGRCKIINPYDKSVFNTIQRGDYFGENESLKIPSNNYFGEIVADDDEVTCLFISNENMIRLPIYEMKAMR